MSANVDILTRIVTAKRSRLENVKRFKSTDELREEAFATRASSSNHRVIQALDNDRINIIAEFKRTSPSRGAMCDDLSASEMTALYESGGAAAVSVLTEEDFFYGSLNDLQCVRRAVSLPVLRKDFIFDEYQVYESAAAAADAILLIVAVLDDSVLKRLRQLAEDELGLDALVEVHTSQELNRAVNSGARLIGVNNRELKTFEVSLATSQELAAEAPDGLMLVSESGLKSADDLRQLHELGYKGFLIGEALMRSKHPDELLRDLISER